MMNQVVYACSKPEHSALLYRSVNSIRRFLPDANVRLYCTLDVHRQLEAWMFDGVHVVQPRFQHRPRFEAMLSVPFGRSLFLDCDTLVLAPLESLFELLLGCELALCPAIQHTHPEGERLGIYKMLPAPECIGEWNGGVMAARVDERFREFVKTWMRHYEQCHIRSYFMDQAALRATVWMYCMRVATLRNNYNFRTMAQQTVVGEVKILHGKGDLESVAARVNQSCDYRLYTPTPSEAGAA